MSKEIDKDLDKVIEAFQAEQRKVLGNEAMRDDDVGIYEKHYQAYFYMTIIDVEKAAKELLESKPVSEIKPSDVASHYFYRDMHNMKNLDSSLSSEAVEVVRDGVDNYLKDNPNLLSPKVKSEVGDFVANQEIRLTKEKNNSGVSMAARAAFDPELSKRIFANLDKRKSKTHRLG